MQPEDKKPRKRRSKNITTEIEADSFSRTKRSSRRENT
jgi:hypothetical protein